jgi:curved DNA-binding protein CbpA
MEHTQQEKTSGDFYEILGVEKTATSEEIKQKYNQLVLLYHPDKGGDTKKFKDLQLAYKILSNDKNRDIYTKSLSSTFQEISDDYRDQKSGQHNAFEYSNSERDFTKGSKQDRDQKLAEFNKQFEDSRDVTDKAMIDKLMVDCQNKDTNIVSIYEQLLKQYEDEIAVPIIPCLMTSEFDINLFNQMFEKNKQSEITDLDRFCEVIDQFRTDLAPVDGHRTFTMGHMNDDDSLSHEFQTYRTNINIDPTTIDTKSTTKTRDMVFDDPKTLCEKYMAERKQFDQSIRQNPQPVIVDDHPMSYGQLGLKEPNL